MDEYKREQILDEIRKIEEELKKKLSYAKRANLTWRLRQLWNELGEQNNA